MSRHWTDRRSDKVALMSELVKRGWTVYGYKEDRSDLMVDYYDPPRWDGIAQKGAAVLVVDAYSASTGHQPTKRVVVSSVPCHQCAGRGYPEGAWTLTQALANPREFHRTHRIRTGEAGFPLFPDVVSGLTFRNDGRERCHVCHGEGLRHTYGEVPDGPRWPAHAATPKRKTWHVEVDGAIVASGVGLAAFSPEWREGETDEETRARGARNVERLLDRIESAAATGRKSAAAPAAAAVR